MADWLPAREQDFTDLCRKWVSALEKADNMSSFNWDRDECREAAGKIRTFLDARAVYEEDDSTAKRIAKDEAKEDARDAIRDFANTYVRFNKRMTDAEKISLGIHPKDSRHTPHPNPSNQPDTIVENTINHYEHKVKALNRETGDTGKPEDAYGVKYAWQVGGNRPSSGEDLPKSHFTRKTSHTVTHTEADKGKPAYYATRYENAKGEGGPWSPVVESYIG